MAPSGGGAAAGANVSLGEFEDTLAPFGTWYATSAYGAVWVPSPSLVGANFLPYSCGQWVFTEYGWTWASCYSWGWAPFHYGRWAYFDTLGWAWVPGAEWGPAWVSWRAGSGFVGWAPLGPGDFVFPAAFHAPWSFVDLDDFQRGRFAFVPREHTLSIWMRTRPLSNRSVIGNVVFDRGPPRADIERVAGRPVPVRPLARVPTALPPAAVVGRRLPPPPRPRPPGPMPPPVPPPRPMPPLYPVPVPPGRPIAPQGVPRTPAPPRAPPPRPAPPSAPPRTAPPAGQRHPQ